MDPGAKLTISPASLPLTLDIVAVRAPSSNLGQRLVLGYTGMSLLARILLESVLPRWHAHLPETVDAN